MVRGRLHPIWVLRITGRLCIAGTGPVVRSGWCFLRFASDFALHFGLLIKVRLFQNRRREIFPRHCGVARSRAAVSVEIIWRGQIEETFANAFA